MPSTINANCQLITKPNEETRKIFPHLETYSVEELDHIAEIIRKNEELQRIEEERIKRLHIVREVLSSQSVLLPSTSQTSCYICQSRFLPIFRPASLCQQCCRETCSSHIVKLHSGNIIVCNPCHSNNQFVTTSGLWFKEEQSHFSKDEGSIFYLKHFILALKGDIPLKCDKDGTTNSTTNIDNQENILTDKSVLPSESDVQLLQMADIQSIEFACKTSQSGKDRTKFKWPGGGAMKTSTRVLKRNSVQESIPEELEPPPSPRSTMQSNNSFESSSLYSSLLSTTDIRTKKRFSLSPSDGKSSVNLFNKSKTSSISSSKKRFSSIQNLSQQNGDFLSLRGEGDGQSIHNSEPERQNKGLHWFKSKSVTSILSNESSDDPTNENEVTGEICVALEYNFKRSQFFIRVKECRNLHAIDNNINNVNPYVKTYLLPDKSKSGKRTTTFRRKTINPVYHEEMEYQIHYVDLLTRTLEISVWQRQLVGPNGFLGEKRIPLADWNFKDKIIHWYALQHKQQRPLPFLISSQRPEIVLAIKYETPTDKSENVKHRGGNTSSRLSQNPTGVLNVWIKEGKNLFQNPETTKCKLFVEICLQPDDTKFTRKRTSVIKDCNNPKWNTIFYYANISGEYLKQTSLEITVCHRGSIKGNTLLGGIRLNRGNERCSTMAASWMDATGNEMTIWRQMVTKPGLWIEETFPLRPHFETCSFQEIS